MTTNINGALDRLIRKYGLPPGEIIDAEHSPAIRTHGGEFALLPWRVERRFIELKNLIDNNTLEHVSTLRFASITAGGDLLRQVARELDLATWLAGSPVASLFAACSGRAAANLIVKLESGIRLSIECCNRLPAGRETIDRHKIIARRGVASDRVVDTQVPQSSIYAFTHKGDARHTDTDAELFGLSEPATALVRAAFAVLRDPALGAEWNTAAAASQRLIEAMIQSDATSAVVSLQGKKTT